MIFFSILGQSELSIVDAHIRYLIFLIYWSWSRCRQIWSCFCFNSISNICCIVLCSIRPRRYDIVIAYFKTFSPRNLIYCNGFYRLNSGSVGLSFLQFTNMNSMRNLFITGLSLFLGISIPQFFDEYWTPNRRGLVHTNAGWVSSRSSKKLKCEIEMNLKFPSCAVQCVLEHGVHVPAHGGADHRGVPWQHDRGGEVEEGPGDAVVGEVQDLQRRQSQRGVLHVAV